MHITYNKFNRLFSVITRLCWMITLCLSLYVLKYVIAMGTLPLDLCRTESVVFGMIETVIFCVVMIVSGQIGWECLKNLTKTR